MALKSRTTAQTRPISAGITEETSTSIIVLVLFRHFFGKALRIFCGPEHIAHLGHIRPFHTDFFHKLIDQRRLHAVNAARCR